MHVMTVKDREPYADQRNIRILGRKLQMRAADGQINRIIQQQRPHMPQVISDIQGGFRTIRA
ncbi:hypothetical protein D3C72_2469880 [compost metagenome]